MADGAVTRLALGLAMALLAADAAAGQSLGEIARREADRRRQVADGRQYTNDDLRPEPQPAPSTAVQAAAAESAAAAGDTKSEAAAATSTDAKALPPAREKRPEPYWRERAQQLRAMVQKAREEVTALEARSSGLDAAGASRAAAREGDVTREALGKARQNLRFFTEELQQFEQRARRANVPPEWTQ